MTAPTASRGPFADRWPSRAGFVAAALAVVPLAGWGAAWPTLAAVAAGWPPVSPSGAIAVLAGGLGLAVQHPSSPRTLRRGGALAAAAAVALVALVALVRRSARVPTVALSDAVDGWHRSPALLFDALPSVSGAIALLFLAIALAGVGSGGRLALRLAYIAAAAAAMVALLTAGVSPLQRAGVADPLLVPAPDRLVPPALALGVLLLATGVLMRRGDDGGWWLPARGPAAAVARSLLPVIVLLPPAAAWMLELLERRRVLQPEEAMVVLPALLVVSLGAALGLAVFWLQRSEHRDRDRDARRLRRQALREAEQVAAQAEATLRQASDHYRAHLRTVLDVAPVAFLALDRRGRVSYANEAAGRLLGAAPAELQGAEVAEAWPGAGVALRDALADAPLRAAVDRSITDPRTGRPLAVRAFPSDEGVAVYVAEG